MCVGDGTHPVTYGRDAAPACGRGEDVCRFGHQCPLVTLGHQLHRGRRAKGSNVKRAGAGPRGADHGAEDHIGLEDPALTLSTVAPPGVPDTLRSKRAAGRLDPTTTSVLA